MIEIEMKEGGRRIFYIDLPDMQAEQVLQYIKEVKEQFECRDYTKLVEK